VAEGSPDTLGGRESAATTIRFSLPGGSELADRFRARRVGDDYQLETDTPTRTLHQLTDWALAADLELLGLQVFRPSLEDVYLSLTGGTGDGDEVAP
jgi:ABC-2 type transport system ATP-binding protein